MRQLSEKEFIDFMKRRCVEVKNQRDFTIPMLSEECGRINAYEEMASLIEVWQERSYVD